MITILMERYKNNDRQLLHAIITDNMVQYLYDLLIVEFDRPFGKDTMELAEGIYTEMVQPYIAMIKLFNPLLR